MNGNISKFKGISGDGIGNQIEALVPEIGYANLIDTYIPRQKAAKLYRIEKGSVMNEDGEPGISLDRGYYYIVALGVWEGAGEGEPLTRQYRLDADGFYCRDYIVHIGGENEWTPWKDISNFPMSLVAGREMEIEKGIFVQAEDGATIIGDLRERLYDSEGVPVEGNVATGLYSLATGMAATATGDMSISLGGQSRTTGYGSMAMGSGAEASGYGAVAVGLLAKALADYTTVIGEGSEARGKGAVCLGDLTDANGDWALAIGYGVKSNAELSIAIGSFMTKANGKNSVAIGTNVEAISPGSVVIGNSNVRDNDDKYAIILANGRGRLNNALTIDWEDKAEFSGDVYIKGKRALRDGDVVIDSALNETSENPVQNKVVTESINEIRASVTSLTDATTSTVKCHVGDAIPTGESVEFKSIHSGSESTASFFDDNFVTTTEGHVGDIANDMTNVSDGFADPLDITGQTIAKITSTTLGIECTSYDENIYVMFEVVVAGEIPAIKDALEEVVVGEIPAIKDALSELETEIDTDLPTIENKLDNVIADTAEIKEVCGLTYDTYTANIHVGEKVPTGSSVKLLHVRGSNGEIDTSTGFSSTGIATENETHIPIETDMVKFDNWGVIKDVTGEMVTKITSTIYDFECTSYDENIYAVFEVTVARLLVDEKVEVLEGNVASLETDLLSVTGSRTRIKCHVGDNIPTGSSVTLKAVYSDSGEGTSSSFVVMAGFEPQYVNNTISSDCQGVEISTIVRVDSSGSQSGVGEYNENWYAVFELEVDGVIPALEERIAALEAVIANIQNAEEASF